MSSFDATEEKTSVTKKSFLLHSGVETTLIENWTVNPQLLGATPYNR